MYKKNNVSITFPRKRRSLNSNPGPSYNCDFFGKWPNSMILDLPKIVFYICTVVWYAVLWFVDDIGEKSLSSEFIKMCIYVFSLGNILVRIASNILVRKYPVRCRDYRMQIVIDINGTRCVLKCRTFGVLKSPLWGCEVSILVRRHGIKCIFPLIAHLCVLDYYDNTYAQRLAYAKTDK